MSTRPRRTWTPAEKAALTAQLRRRTAAGESFAEVARSLGIHQSTLRLWLRLQPDSAGIAQVTIVDAPAPTSAGNITLTTPDGFFFSDLDLDTAAALWSRLR